MLHRLIEISRDILQILAHYDNLERREIKTGLGIYYQDSASHVHIKRKENGDA